MRPFMSDGETALLARVLSSTRNYVEFGCGGSTVLASETVGHAIYSSDSSVEWIEKVADACTRVRPQTVWTDIGETGEWGYPVDESRRDEWPGYYDRLWQAFPAAQNADTFLVDGRFRVACFMKILLMANANPIVMIHDFERDYYHPILDVAEPIATAENLVVFRRKTAADPVAILHCLNAHAYDTR